MINEFFGLRDRASGRTGIHRCVNSFWLRKAIPEELRAGSRFLHTRDLPVSRSRCSPSWTSCSRDRPAGSVRRGRSRATQRCADRAAARSIVGPTRRSRRTGSAGTPAAPAARRRRPPGPRPCERRAVGEGQSRRRSGGAVGGTRRTSDARDHGLHQDPGHRRFGVFHAGRRPAGRQDRDVVAPHEAPEGTAAGSARPGRATSRWPPGPSPARSAARGSRARPAVAAPSTS